MTRALIRTLAIAAPQGPEKLRIESSAGSRGVRLYRGKGICGRVAIASASAVSALVAPVILITAAGLLGNGLILVAINMTDRVRELTRERREMLTKTTDIDRDRLHEIDRELPMSVGRLSRIRDSFIVVYASIAMFTIGVALLALAVALHAPDVGLSALAIVLAGVLVLLTGLGIAVGSLVHMSDPVAYEVKRTGLLG